ncbi:di-trans,poly-cis-decaprenylcistransferase [Candidatus Pacearchaeota archaeon]|nr:di-trans,poly-cis-decaprenylcistransferase [Candidatus Pacearchaeota archaeon]
MNTPKHLAIIPDGNRRFAKRLMFKPQEGYKYGTKKYKEILDWCMELGIKNVTFYIFSLENFNRPKKEFDFLMNLFEKEFKEMATNPKIHKNQVKINFIGRIHLLPKNVQKEIKKLMNTTKNYNNFQFNFAIAYGGRAEIVDATKKIVKLVKEGKLKIKEINEKSFSENLYNKGIPDVDLIIRTSEQRISGFLPWQSVYSELIFLPNKFFPELTKKDFLNIIRGYGKRERRFGK